MRRSHISEDKASVSWLIEEAVHQGKLSSRHVKPTKYYISSIDKPGALNFILGQHPFPLCQGPIVIPLDNNTAWDDVKKRENDCKGSF